MERMLLRHWFCAGHVSSIPRAGDYLVVDLGPESVIIVRNSAGDVRALLNVCRHRGSRLCAGRSGKAQSARLTCPYHAWSYDLDGKLLVARQMPESFRPDDVALKTLPVRIMEGLIFATFAKDPLDLGVAPDALARSAGVHGWASAKVAHRELYSIGANWKLAIENYMECYHCTPARPAELNVELERAGRTRAEALGIVVPDIDQYGCAAGSGRESVAVMRSALHDGIVSATDDGRSVGRLTGLWKTTSAEDKKIVEMNQAGVNSRFFEPGPYSLQETYAARFVDWYLDELSAGIRPS